MLFTSHANSARVAAAQADLGQTTELQNQRKQNLVANLMGHPVHGAPIQL